MTDTQSTSPDQFLDHLEATHSTARMVGWDFSRLDGRMTTDSPWWDFESDCLDAMRRARGCILDLGTGGGERLSDLLARSDGGDLAPVFATEGWEPNVPVARERLEPLGVTVSRYEPDADDVLPFPDAGLDVVMSRHESIDAAEVARALAPGGRLLTQQVDGFDAPEIHEWFESDYLYADNTVGVMSDSLRSAGLTVDRVDRWEGSMRFTDVEALVVYLALVPWECPDFEVRRHAVRLLELRETSPLAVTQRRFRIYATKR